MRALLLSLLVFGTTVTPTTTTTAQPSTTLRSVALPGGTPAHFDGTRWSYTAGDASTVTTFRHGAPDAYAQGAHGDVVRIEGTVGDQVKLMRPVLPGALPASVRSASHLVFDAQGEGTVLVALEVSDHAEPFVYPVALHPGAETFRVALKRFRQRGSGTHFDGDTVVRVSFLHVARPDTEAAFALTVGGLSFDYKRPLSARY
ncbi:MAG: hypothetical protein AAFN13_09220 [Bacteroidota bacterium]